jgi:uncharacterized protein YdaL
LLLTFGLIYKGAKDETTTYIHIGIILFFLTLIINQLSVWTIKRENDTLRFSNFFGLNVRKIDELEDYQSIDAYISHHPYRSSEMGEHLTLVTSKGTFRFNSRDYVDFNQTIDLLFQDRRDLKQDFKNNIHKQRKTHIDQTWIYYLISLVLLLLVYLKDKLF